MGGKSSVQLRDKSSKLNQSTDVTDHVPPVRQSNPSVACNAVTKRSFDGIRGQCYVWKVCGVSELVNKASRFSSVLEHSDSFGLCEDDDYDEDQCPQPCYRAQLAVSLASYKGSVWVYPKFRLVPGPDDDRLSWPLQGQYQFALGSIDRKSMFRKSCLVTTEDYKEHYCRPKEGASQDWMGPTGMDTVDRLTDTGHVADDAFDLVFRMTWEDRKYRTETDDI